MGLPRFAVLLALVLAIIIATAMWFWPSNDDFRAENPFWNGTEVLGSLIPVSPLESLSELSSLPRGSALILIPYLPFGQAELEALNSFLSRGGTLVLADDYGYGNQVLKHLGLEVRFSGYPLLDPLTAHKNEWLPSISRLESDWLTDGVEGLVFNHATCLSDVDGADIIARSSSFSFLDINDNQTWDEGEATGPLPVISRHNLSEGQVILIADPSIFINAMETLDGNLSFIQNINANSDGLYIDQSHLSPSNLHQARILLTGSRDFFVTPGGTLALVLVALLAVPVMLWYGKKEEGGGKTLLKGDNNDFRTG